MIEMLFVFIALLLPGLILSFLIFEEASRLERAIFSFASSISLLVIIFLNLNALYHIPVSLENVLAVSLVLIFLFAAFKLSYLHAKRK